MNLIKTLIRLRKLKNKIGAFCAIALENEVFYSEVLSVGMLFFKGKFLVFIVTSEEQKHIGAHMREEVCVFGNILEQKKEFDLIFRN